MLNYLKLIRYRYLLLLAFMQLIFRFGFLKLQNITLALSDWQYILLVLSTICLMAGGAVINAVFQQESDSENKSEFQVIGKFIPENTAYNLYIALTFVGVLIGFYLSNAIQKPNFAILFILIASTLYFYASSMKNSVLIGNFIIALTTTTYILIIGLFDLLPITNAENQAVMGLHFSILIDYAIFTFIISFINELVLDIENLNGDNNQGLVTLAVVIGVSKAKKVVLAISFFPILCVAYYLKIYILDAKLLYSFMYGLLFIVSPLVYFLIKVATAKNQKNYRHLNIILKSILFFTFLSIFVISLNIKHNA